MNNNFTTRVEFRKYIVKSRWWPWKNTWRDIIITDYEEIGGFIYILFKVDDKLFQLPLIKVDKIPSGLETRSFCIEDSCFVEAEYSIEYLNYITKLSKHSIETYDSILFKIYSVKPLSLETTNVTVIYDTNIGRIVLKNYRLIPRVNTEYLILKKLVEENYKYIPRIIGFLKYRDIVSGILMYYVKSSGDGGKPFYDLFFDKLKGLSKNGLEKILSSKLGFIISEMHKALNYSVRDSFYGVEEISDRDVDYWIKRCEKYYKTSFSQIDRYVSESSSCDRLYFEYWRYFYEKVSRDLLTDLSELLIKQRDLYKGRIHQDLHLAQMIYVEETSDFIITDFEGEPGRSDEERFMKEPLFRDIASIIRSFQYLTYSAILNYYERSIHDTSLTLLRNDPSIEWRKNIAYWFINEYLSKLTGYNLISPSEKKVIENYWFYIKPWLIERSLYEIYYESLYRPLWISIPIIGLQQILMFNI